MALRIETLSQAGVRDGSTMARLTFNKVKNAKPAPGARAVLLCDGGGPGCGHLPARAIRSPKVGSFGMQHRVQRGVRALVCIAAGARWVWGPRTRWGSRTP
jgi:hypothetical protein